MKWSVGGVEIDRIVEIERFDRNPEQLLDGLTAQQVLACEWMCPHFCTDQGEVTLAFHGFLVRTADKIILIDTCFGAGRTLPSPVFSNLDRRFITNLAAVGVEPGDVDI